MFVICFDDELKEKLKLDGFKLLNQDKDKAVFIYNKNNKFNFNKVNKKKFLFTNKLNF